MEINKKTVGERISEGASEESSEGDIVAPPPLDMVRSRPVFKGDRCDGNCAGCRRDLRNCFGCDCNGKCGGRKRKRSKRRKHRRTRRRKHRRTRRRKHRRTRRRRTRRRKTKSRK